MRSSDVGDRGHEEDCIGLFPCIEEWRAAMVGKPVDRNFKIGALVEAVPSSSRPFGTLYKLKVGGSTAVGVTFNAKETNPEIVIHDGGETVKDVDMDDIETKRDDDKRKQTLRILDVDPFSDVVDLSMEREVVSGSGKKFVLPSGNEVWARVVLVKHIYIILSVEVAKKKSVIAFAIFPPLHDALQLRPGTLLKCKVIKAGGKGTDRNLIAINWAQHQERSKAGKERRPPSNLHDIASISVLKSTAAQDESGVIGMQVSGKVTKSFSSHVFIGIGPGVVGHLHVTNTGTLSEQELNTIPLGPLSNTYASRYSLPEIGSIVRPAYVCGIRRHEDKENKLPMVLDLSLNKTSSCVKPEAGVKVLGFVQHVSTRLSKSGSEEKDNKRRTLVSAGSESWISVSDVNCLFEDQKVNIEPGIPVMLMITKTDQGSKQLEGTISENGSDHDKAFFGIVKDVIPGHGVKVLIPWNARREEEKSTSWGIVDICDVSSDFEDVVQKMQNLKDGDVIRVQRVLDPENKACNKKPAVCLTMRTPKSDSDARDPLVSMSTVAALKTGTQVRGFVRAVDKKGCFVSIGRGVSAHVKLCDLSDEFVPDPKVTFPVGKLVQGKLTSKEGDASKLSMVLRRRPRRKLAEDVSHKELAEGTKVTGTVRKIESYGALIGIENAGVALLHKSEVDQDRFVNNTFEEWEVGQVITAIVIKVRKGKVNVGTKRCYFEAAGMNDDEVSAVLEENQRGRGLAISGKQGVLEMDVIGAEINEDEAKIGENANDEGQNEEINDFDSCDTGVGGERGLEEDGVQTDCAPSSNLLFDQQLASSAPPLKVAHGFSFDEQPDMGMTSEQDGQEDMGAGENVEKADMIGNKNKKSSREKREKKREKEALEREIRTREETIANNPNAPETVEDYERLLMGDPNNSVLWIRYMAFCLGLSQIDKARSVAERALESISLESEAERVNLWCAYVNMEASFGMMNSRDPELNDSLGVKRDAAVLRVFDRGCERITDVKDFHLRVSSALRESNPGLSEEILRRATRRFKAYEDVWIAKGQNHFIDGNLQDARQTLERALMSLEKQRHIATISKFAQFEYKYGSPERGRTVFESLVGSFPKRLDLWNVYLDMEVRRCSKAESTVLAEIVEQVRTLYQRLVRLDLSSKKMKFACKKWLNFEKTFGSRETQAAVKKHAREYIERNMPNTD
ncbi:S1 RNA binding protein [Gracilaria domingensis]|nr:S1 RNA binding protein [Gracilaria domingensis]